MGDKQWQQVSRVCAARHLPSTSHNGASVVGIRNTAKSQTQRWQDIQSIRLRDQKTKPNQTKTKKPHQNGEALARDGHAQEGGSRPGGRLAGPQHFLYTLLAGSWRDCSPALPLLTLQDDPVNTKPSPMAPQSQDFSSDLSQERPGAGQPCHSIT